MCVLVCAHACVHAHVLRMCALFLALRTLICPDGVSLLWAERMHRNRYIYDSVRKGTCPRHTSPEIPEESRCHRTYGKQAALAMQEAPGDATAVLTVASKTKKAAVGRGGSISCVT